MLKYGKKIIVLTTSEELTCISRRAVKKLGLSIKVEEIKELKLKDSISKLIERSQEYKRNGVEYIITRHGGEQLLKPNVEVNTIDIEISGCDILKCLHKYKGYNKPIAVVDSFVFIEKVRSIGEILGLDIHSYRTGHKDLHKKIDEAINDKNELLIIGSGGFQEVEKDYIIKKGAKFEQIESSEESVIEAIRKACKLYEVAFIERKKAELLKTVLDFSNQGIISIDINENISTFNPKAERIFRQKESDIVGKPIQDVISSSELTRTLLAGKIETGIIRNYGNFQVVGDRVPIIINDEIVGAVETFQEVEHVQEIEQKIRCNILNKGLTAKYTFQSIKGKSDKIKKIIEMAKIYSDTASTVLITGETGTGKEVFAQAVHNESNRKNKPFVAINCSALPGNLLESELFGYAEGAFTGARKGGKLGIFELAHKGTIFLDEIGEIDKTVQARLLRVIQEREVMRIGDDKIIPVDVRIIAATNRDLYNEVENGNFRSDLYFRLDILSFNIPPLRERKEDIEELANEFIEKLNRRLKCKVANVDNDIMKIFKDYEWPGNIRELQNMLEKMVVLTKIGTIRYKEVSYILHRIENKILDTRKDDIYSSTLEEIEKKVIMKVLEKEKNNKTRTAKKLGIDRTTLLRKLERYS